MRFAKNINFWKGFTIVVVLIVATVAFFPPEAINYKYPYSYKALKDKKNQVEQLNLDLQNNEANIAKSIEEFKNLVDDGDSVKSEAKRIRNSINDKDFELDIPSILINLEQTSIKKKVILEIDYNSITHIKSSGEIEEYEGIEESEVEDKENETENDDRKEAQEESEDIKVEKKKKNEKESENNDKKKKLSEEDIKKSAIQINDIDVTVIPIYIEGSYYNVRKYINFLDEVGMIEPSSVILDSKGNSVSVSIVLNVFHGEVGL